jgi:hypothetical protein
MGIAHKAELLSKQADSLHVDVGGEMSNVAELVTSLYILLA